MQPSSLQTCLTKGLDKGYIILKANSQDIVDAPQRPAAAVLQRVRRAHEPPRQADHHAGAALQVGCGTKNIDDVTKPHSLMICRKSCGDGDDGGVDMDDFVFPDGVSHEVSGSGTF